MKHKRNNKAGNRSFKTDVQKKHYKKKYVKLLNDLNKFIILVKQMEIRRFLDSIPFYEPTKQLNLDGVTCISEPFELKTDHPFKKYYHKYKKK